jgi:FKBP-type peptidyl-prolyl cis-trans isomerase
MGVVLLAGCSKNNGCRPVPIENEKAQLEAFNTEIGMNGTWDSRGFFHEVIARGSNNTPQQTSTIFVRYKGTFLDGKVFEQQTVPGNTGFVLNNMIDAWKYAIPMIGKGGKIRISLASAIGYGCQGASRGAVPIPPNSPLFFEIELVDFF